MWGSQKLNQTTGMILVCLTIASAVLGLAGVWGFVDSNTGGQLILTFAIMAATTCAVGGIADKFWKGR